MNAVRRGLVTFSVCSTLTAAPTAAVTVTEVFGDEWKCSLMPNSVYGPGVIYEEGSGGIRFLVDLSKSEGLKVTSGKAAVGKIVDARAISSDLKLGLLARVLKGINASLGWTVKSTKQSIITYELDSYVVTPGAPREQARFWMKQNAIAEIGKRYFLIREAVSAKNVEYFIEDGTVAKLEGDLTAKGIVNASGNLAGVKTAGGYLLKRALVPSLWACSVADEIKPKGSLTGEVAWEFVKAPQSESYQNEMVLSAE